MFKEKYFTFICNLSFSLCLKQSLFYPNFSPLDKRVQTPSGPLENKKMNIV